MGAAGMILGCFSKKLVSLLAELGIFSNFVSRNGVAALFYLDELDSIKEQLEKLKL